MMLFGDLKAGGWLTITTDKDKLVLNARGKTVKVPLLTIETKTEDVTENN
jgi:hypothetical protein